jgi:DNA-binding NarL/FixJ family response regulator
MGPLNGASEGSPVKTAEARKPRLRIVLADDHHDVREQIRELLASEFDVISAVSGGLQLLEEAAALHPDLVVSDIAMPDLDGIEAGRRSLDRGFARAAVLLTMHNDPQLLQRARDAGITGFVLKVDAGEELIAAVEQVAAGKTYISRTVRRD